MKKTELSKLLAFFVTWKVFLMTVGFTATLVLLYKPSFPLADAILAPTGLPQWLYSWANFDGVHYLTIAEKGYVGTGLIQAFFPVFPYLLSTAPNTTTRIIFGLIVNTLLAFSLLLLFKKLVEHDHKKIGWLAVLALFLFPTAFFLHALYTEALFLLLVVSSFYMARQGKWWLAGMLAAIASATRIVGIALVPALLVEAWLQRPQLKQRAVPIMSAMIGTTGLVAYMAYLWKTFGDPLFFLHVQEEFGSGRSESIIVYPQVVWRYIKILVTYRPFNLAYGAYVQEFVVGLMGLLGVLLSWFKVRQSYVVFSFIAFLIPTLTGTFSSMPRYVLSSFVIFILIAQFLNGRRLLQVAYFTVSTLLLVFNTILFIQGYWVA